MKADVEAPADTRMMGIVHRALRRDLNRVTTVLSNDVAPDERQRRAIGAQLEWVMEFLEAHHAGEDEGLYPMVVERDPEASRLVEAMHGEHELIAPRIADITRLAETYAHDDAPTAHERLATAIRALEDVLLPHLQREEDEMMPVVSQALTNGEWIAWDEQYNLKPKSPVQLGFEGHWLIDEASPGDQEIVKGLVPPVPRFVLLHGFAGPYRRRRARWFPDGRVGRRQVQKSCRTEVTVDVDIDRVWDVVRDPTRVGEWSHECTAARWIGGATEAVPGARFRGRNRAGIVRWGRECEVVSAEPTRLVWRTVPSTLYPDSSEWTIALHPTTDGGTVIEQAFRMLKIAPLIEPIFATLNPGHRDRTEALAGDLRRIGQVAGERVTVRT